MKSSPSTRLSRTFCSARDRNIPVLVKAATDSTDSGEMELVSCLDYGFRCTGWLCPLFSLPTLPPESLLEEAIEVERGRQARATGNERAILERALKEGRTQRTTEAARREAAKRRRRQDPTRLPDPKERA
jgi:hypothetical protein